jgi:hypothetical protein
MMTTKCLSVTMKTMTPETAKKLAALWKGVRKQLAGSESVEPNVVAAEIRAITKRRLAAPEVASALQRMSPSAQRKEPRPLKVG